MRTVRALLILASAVLLAAPSRAPGCGADVDQRAGEGVRVRRVRLREPSRVPGGASAQPGDYWLESAAVRVLVGGLGRPPAQRGAILEAADQRASRHEGIVRLAPTVHVARRRHRVVVDTIRIVARDGRPRLRTTGTVELPSGTRLHHSREIAISARHAGIGLSDEAWTEEGTVSLRFGADIGWGGDVPFVPGVGPLADDAWHDASFVGLGGVRTGTVFVAEDGPLRVAAAYEVHGDARFLEATEVVSSQRHAGRRRAARSLAFLVVAQRGMAEALRTASWLRGARLRESYVHVPNAPRGARVLVRTVRGEPLIDVRVDARGGAVVPLPPIVDRPADRFLAVAGAEGHADGDAVGFLAGESFVAEVPRGGRVRITVLDAVTGANLPARVRFVPAKKPSALDLGPEWSALGARDTVIVTAGSGEVAVPEGRYRVLVTHGPEWTLHEQTIDVSPTFRPDVHAELTHVVDPVGYVGCDLHVHAAPSPDSQVELEDRVASLVAEGIGFAVPTDHNHVTDYGPASEWLGYDDGTFLTVPGVEATPQDPYFGHFNGYPVPVAPDAPHQGAPPFVGVDPPSLFASLRALGPDVVVQVNHPRLEGNVGYFDMVGYDARTGHAVGPYSDDYDLLEVWNGFDLARRHAFEQTFSDWLAMIGRGRRVTAVGNSDSHQIRYQWAGYPRTYVRPDEATPEAIVRALRAGRAFVTSGPFLEARVDEAGPGDTATARGGVAALRVRVQTAPFMAVDRLEVYVAGTKVRELPLRETLVRAPRPRNAPRGQTASARLYVAAVDIPVPRDAGLVVLVRGERTLDEFFARNGIPPLAFSNPIWIDADGDGVGPIDPGDPAPEPGTFEAVPRRDAGPPPE